jgi:hypothetical protein
MDAPNNRGRRQGGRRGRGPRRGPSNGNQAQGQGQRNRHPAPEDGEDTVMGNDDDAAQSAPAAQQPQAAPMGPNGPVPLATRRFADLSESMVHPTITQTVCLSRHGYRASETETDAFLS